MQKKCIKIWLLILLAIIASSVAGEESSVKSIFFKPGEVKIILPDNWRVTNNGYNNISFLMNNEFANDEFSDFRLDLEAYNVLTFMGKLPNEKEDLGEIKINMSVQYESFEDRLAWFHTQYTGVPNPSIPSQNPSIKLIYNETTNNGGYKIVNRGYLGYNNEGNKVYNSVIVWETRDSMTGIMGYWGTPPSLSITELIAFSKMMQKCLQWQEPERSSGYLIKNTEIYESPSSHAPIIKKCTDGMYVTYVDEQQTLGFFPGQEQPGKWYKIAIPNSTITGWIFSRSIIWLYPSTAPSISNSGQ